MLRRKSCLQVQGVVTCVRCGVGRSAESGAPWLAALGLYLGRNRPVPHRRKNSGISSFTSAGLLLVTPWAGGQSAGGDGQVGREQVGREFPPQPAQLPCYWLHATWQRNRFSLASHNAAIASRHPTSLPVPHLPRLPHAAEEAVGRVEAPVLQAQHVGWCRAHQPEHGEAWGRGGVGVARAVTSVNGREPREVRWQATSGNTSAGAAAKRRMCAHLECCSGCRRGREALGRSWPSLQDAQQVQWNPNKTSNRRIVQCSCNPAIPAAHCPYSSSPARTSVPLPQHAQAARVESAHWAGQVSKGGWVGQVQCCRAVVAQYPWHDRVLRRK